MIHFYNKNFLFTLVLIILFPIAVFSSNDAETLFKNKEYAKAKIVYQNLLKRNQNSVLYNYRYARCCYELKENDQAIIYFEKAGDRYALRNFYLGELYFYAYRFDESIEAYNNYISTLDLDDERIPNLKKSIKKTELGARLFNRVEDIAIIDSILVNKNNFLKFYNFSKDLGSLSSDRIQLKDFGTMDRVKYTTERGDRMCFSDTVNSNLDIFSSFKLLDNWSKPVSISNQINTLSNESYPFLLLDGVTLFYASDSEESLGGYDIFMTRYSANSKTYLNSENIGMPFNSPYNDYMMVINELNKIGWFATDRNQVKDSIVIYQFEYNDPKKYFRSEDLEEQRQVARLAKYRKLDNIDFSNQTSTQINVKNKTPDCSDFVLVINDSTRYDCLEQIQSETALNKIKEWLIIKENQSQRKNELDKLRNDYALTENEDQKQKLKEKIISNEQQYFETEVILKNKLIEATNEEIKFIRIN